MNRGQCFGERALITREARLFNVMALAPCKALRLHHLAFEEQLGSLAALQSLWRFEALGKVPLFNGLSNEQRARVAGALRPREVKKAQAVVTQVCVCVWGGG